MLSFLSLLLLTASRVTRENWVTMVFAGWLIKIETIITSIRIKFSSCPFIFQKSLIFRYGLENPLFNIQKESFRPSHTSLHLKKPLMCEDDYTLKNKETRTPHILLSLIIKYF